MELPRHVRLLAKIENGLFRTRLRVAFVRLALPKCGVHWQSVLPVLGLEPFQPGREEQTLLSSRSFRGKIVSVGGERSSRRVVLGDVRYFLNYHHAYVSSESIQVAHIQTRRMLFEEMKFINEVDDILRRWNMGEYSIVQTESIATYGRW